MLDEEKAIQVRTSVELSIDRLTTAVRVLQQTVDHWDMDDEYLPETLKKQAH